MARHTRAAKIENRTARLKLAVQRKPYFVPVAPRIGLGYRRNRTGGAWVVRAADGHGGNWTKAFAIADDHEEANGETVLNFWQAQDRARAIARGGEGTGERPATVAEALDHYEADLSARGGDVGNARRVRFQLPDTLAAKTVALLGARELRQWRDGLVKHGIKPASADRSARALKAALNLAANDDPSISNRSAWRTGLARLPDAESARNVILPDAGVRVLVAAAYEIGRDFGLFVELAAITGARTSQLLRLQVGDLQGGPAPRLMMPGSRKGRRRRVGSQPLPIPPSLAATLRQAAGDRPANAPLLIREDGTRWSRIFDRVLFRRAIAKAGLDPSVTPYALRHSSIVRQLLAAVPIRVVAAHHDTSVAMLEKTYSKNIIGDPSDAITRRALLDMGEAAGDNVVPIGAKS